jgi:CubicO group peptidase (beta-lactamase class C family)
MIGILLALLLLLPAAPQRAGMRTGTRTDEIAAAIKSRVDARRSSGMVVATLEPDGSSSIASYGDPGPGAKPLDADSVFEIGSITKVFTAIVLADMVDRGEVRLDDPVAKFLPEGVRVPSRGGRQITLLDLTTQTSGLPRMPDNLRPRDPANPYADYTAEQMFEFLGRYTLPRDIGSQFEYSNLGVGLLGQALSRRAGKSYEVLVRERILAPLGMTHTGVALTPWMREHLALGHDTQLRVAANWDLPAFAGAGALRSTMNDMIVFARANLGWRPGATAAPGDAVTRVLRVMAQTHVARKPTDAPGMSIGMNWLIRRVGDRDVVWHNGGTGGYRTWIGFDKARKVGAIVLTNSTIGHDDLGVSLVTGTGG